MPLIDQLLGMRKFLAAPFLVPLDFQEWLQLPAGNIYLSQIESFSQRFEQLLNSLDEAPKLADNATEKSTTILQHDFTVQHDKTPHEITNQPTTHRDKLDISSEHNTDQQNPSVKTIPVATQWKDALIGEEIHHKATQNGLIHNCVDKMQTLLEKYPLLNDFLERNIEALQPAVNSWKQIRSLVLCLIEIEKSEMSEISAQIVEAQIEPEKSYMSKLASQIIEPQKEKTPKSSTNKSGKSEISRPKINLENIKIFATELAKFLNEMKQVALATALTSFTNNRDSFIGTPRLKHLIVIYNAIFTYISHLPLDHPYRSYIPKICATIESGMPLKSQFFKDKPEFAIYCSGKSHGEKVENYTATLNYWEAINALLSKYLPPDLSYFTSPQQQEYHSNEYARLMQKITAYIQELKKYKLELDKLAPPVVKPTPPVDELLPSSQKTDPDIDDEIKPAIAELEEKTAEQADENMPLVQSDLIIPAPSTTRFQHHLQNPFAVEIRQKLDDSLIRPRKFCPARTSTQQRGFSVGELDLERSRQRQIQLAAQTQGFFAQGARRTLSDISNIHHAPKATDQFRAELSQLKQKGKRMAEPPSITDEYKPSAPKCQA